MRTSVLFVFALWLSFGLNGQIVVKARWIDNVDYAKNNPEKVQFLDLSNTQLDAVPKYVSDFKNLIGIKLSDNNISHISDEFSRNKNLEFIELSGNNIQEINFNVFNACKRNLKAIWLRDNDLSVIDSTINILKYLEELHLGRNGIKSFDDNIMLKKLNYLAVDDNQLVELPTFLDASYKLQKLNLNANKITSFKLTEEMRNLKSLDIGDNPIENFEIKSARYKLERLILDWIAIEEEWLTQLPTSVKVLSMEHCELSSLDGISHLKKLKELSVLHNSIDEPSAAHFKSNSRVKKLWF